MKFRLASCLITFTFLGALAVCAQTRPDPPKSDPQASQPPTPGKASETPSVAAVDPNKYVLGAEDVVFIKTWREPDFTFPAYVRPDGKISVNLIGEVQAAGLTPQQLTADLKEKFGKYLNNPDVTVFVTDVRSKKYYIDGEMNRAGAFPLVTPTTVLEALSIAGGFKDFANKKKIKILRGAKTLKFNYTEVTKGKKMEQNIYVQNGDHIIVP
ncbi:MAG: polysaccharide biosynthesis/export family protein [Bryobacteraceae bacterium]